MWESGGKETLNGLEMGGKEVKTGWDGVNGERGVYEMVKRGERVLEVRFRVKVEKGRVKRLRG